jgi:hypothetical protein
VNGVALIGDTRWTKGAAVTAAVKALPPFSIVLVGDEYGVIETSGARQAGCSGFVCLVVRAARKVTDRIVSVGSRDLLMFSLSREVVVFGTLPPGRMELLGECVADRAGTERPLTVRMIEVIS